MNNMVGGWTYELEVTLVLLNVGPEMLHVNTAVKNMQLLQLY